ncbi:MAG: type II toxin-antitoxin system HicA family toxin [Coprothermobacterota bacterium]|nr:type II toxin-antitoxin system HicA family toxin [Coprothermobacterota bacterium]
MKYLELTRKLRQLGCQFTRHGAGSHEIWRNPTTNLQVSIPYHRLKDIGPALLARILSQLGISRKDFDHK